VRTVPQTVAGSANPNLLGSSLVFVRGRLGPPWLSCLNAYGTGNDPSAPLHTNVC
jgi:hypothetical protein